MQTRKPLLGKHCIGPQKFLHHFFSRSCSFDTKVMQARCAKSQIFPPSFFLGVKRESPHKPAHSSLNIDDGPKKSRGKNKCPTYFPMALPLSTTYSCRRPNGCDGSTTMMHPRPRLPTQEILNAFLRLSGGPVFLCRAREKYEGKTHLKATAFGVDAKTSRTEAYPSCEDRVIQCPCRDRGIEVPSDIDYLSCDLLK